MVNKEQILEQIRRTAKENDGAPLGIGRFEKETGISLYDCHKFWPTFGEAQREAGFVANTLQARHDQDFIFESLIALTRELGRFPNRSDFTVKRNSDNNFPSLSSVYRRFGDKKILVQKTLEYAKQKGYSDIVEICSAIEISEKNNESESSGVNQALGEVYLFKSGRYYKIGKTNDTVRRGSELRIQLPEKMDLIHSIKTDDPSGIETYWHRRFEEKRMNGEWFDLNAADIKAFKRWKHIV